MEEESAKRKERLKAMRMEASQSGDYNETQNHLQGLSNPLIESPSGQAEFHAAPRFDYYTDPMAAFSANKKWNDVSPQVSQPCYTPPSKYLVFFFLTSKIQTCAKIYVDVAL